MSMSVQTSHYKRTMKMEAWSKGKEMSLVIIREPKKDRGIATLKVRENIWNYLPKINRVTKVPPSMMSGSWMGSHFTNDDLVKENTFEDDYSSRLSFSGKQNGLDIYEVTSTPKPNAPVVWGKVVTKIEKTKLTPIIALYYDEEGALARTMRFFDTQQRGTRYIPMRLELKPADKPDESTIVTYHEINFDMKLSDRFFSLQNLQKRQ
jgi:outer membrane lipoprotein-sorting protein